MTKTCWFTSNGLDDEIDKTRHAPPLLLCHRFLLTANDGRVKMSSNLGSPVYDTVITNYYASQRAEERATISHTCRKSISNKCILLSY
jgi:hypothetical protein